MYWCIVFIPRFSSVSHIIFWPVSPVPSKLKKEFFSKSSRPLIKSTMTVRSGTWLNGLYQVNFEHIPL